MSTADSAPSFLELPAAERSYRKLVWEEDTKPALVEESKRVDRGSHFATTPRSKAAAWARACLAGDLAAAAETVCPECTLTQQQSLKLGSSAMQEPT